MLRLSQATYKAAAADLNVVEVTVLLEIQAKSRVKHILEPMVAILISKWAFLY